jgi:hypothetical protein
MACLKTNRKRSLKTYKVGHKYPGEGAAILWQPGLALSCSLKDSQKNRVQGKCMLGVLLVPIHRDTRMDLKTEKGGVVKGHNKKRGK